MRKKGVTLAEIIVAAMILAVGLVATLAVYINASIAIQQAKNLSLATQDAVTVLETLRSQNRSAIQSCANTTCWNLTLILDDENISVTNPDASDPTWQNDPLELRVNVSWSERGRTNSISMTSKFTDQ